MYLYVIKYNKKNIKGTFFLHSENFEGLIWTINGLNTAFYPKCFTICISFALTRGSGLTAGLNIAEESEISKHPALPDVSATSAW